MIDLGAISCTLGFHRVVTTREGKTSIPDTTSLPVSTGRGVRTPPVPRTSGAAAQIHAFCYRPGCTFHVIIDTHSGNKFTPPHDGE
jgi:hypothetical protein